MRTRSRCFNGRFQFLTAAASPAPIQLTKLTQSLRLLSLMMTARALRHKFAENYQVFTFYIITFSSDLRRLIIVDKKSSYFRVKL